MKNPASIVLFLLSGASAFLAARTGGSTPDGNLKEAAFWLIALGLLHCIALSRLECRRKSLWNLLICFAYTALTAAGLHGNRLDEMGGILNLLFFCAPAVCFFAGQAVLTLLSFQDKKKAGE
ncbi:MAG: hypothetical protein HPZ91_19070 [Lentisphaeria bacterium]|nr:hypothetical protein [Lentisphaeria bacterium]